MTRVWSRSLRQQWNSSKDSKISSKSPKKRGRVWKIIAVIFSSHIFLCILVSYRKNIFIRIFGILLIVSTWTVLEYFIETLSSSCRKYNVIRITEGLLLFYCCCRWTVEVSHALKASFLEHRRRIPVDIFDYVFFVKVTQNGKLLQGERRRAVFLRIVVYWLCYLLDIYMEVCGNS